MMSLLAPPFLITFSIFLAALYLKHISPPAEEKASPFECGFDPKNSARLPFSSRYFLLAVFFLIFDIETVILLPLPIAQPPPPVQLLAILTFLLILFLGLLHEWREGSLSWSN